MKVLFDHNDPFLFLPGGFQVQIEQTIKAVAGAGVEAEHLRWWDAAQRGDIIHFFGRPQLSYVQFAHRKGMKVVMTNILTGLGSRSAGLRFIQKLVTRASLRLLPAMATNAFGWAAMRAVDASLSQTSWEAFLMHDVFGVPAEKVHVITNGVEPVFLDSQAVPRGPWLVCTATITERKRVLELAQAAVLAQTPLWVIGKPYADSDPYAQQFLQIAREHPKLIRYEGGIQDRARLAEAYRAARGFVLLSTRESLSLSSFEAAACQTPLLLSDLPWARTAFKNDASYCPIASVNSTAKELRRFHDAAPNLPLPPRPMSWAEVACQFKSLYEGLLKTSR
jgi:glycosyltransferase involved in cell wall biosynthesis